MVSLYAMRVQAASANCPMPYNAHPPRRLFGAFFPVVDRPFDLLEYPIMTLLTAPLDKRVSLRIQLAAPANLSYVNAAVRAASACIGIGEPYRAHIVTEHSEAPETLYTVNVLEKDAAPLCEALTIAALITTTADYSPRTYADVITAQLRALSCGVADQLVQDVTPLEYAHFSEPVDRAAARLAAITLRMRARAIMRYMGIYPSLDFAGTLAPTTGRDIAAAFDAARKGADFPVFAGANDSLLFDELTNLAYRFAHDIDHALAYPDGRGTTKYADELRLNALLIDRALSVDLMPAAAASIRPRAALMLAADTLGQAAFYNQHGTFATDQRTLARTIYTRLIVGKTTDGLLQTALDLLQTPSNIEFFM